MRFEGFWGKSWIEGLQNAAEWQASNAATTIQTFPKGPYIQLLVN